MITDYKQYAILYVDDEPANLAAFRFVFEDQFRILTAESGKEALEILDAVQVAILITDQRMPTMSGAELCARARNVHPNVVRMVMTAYADITAAANAINAGQVSRYILKPWKEDELSAIFRAGIDAHQLATVVNALQARVLNAEQQAQSLDLTGFVLHELASPAAALHAAVSWIGELAALAAPLLNAASPEAQRIGRDLLAAGEEAMKCSRLLSARLEQFRRGDQASPAPTAALVTPGRRTA